MNINKAFRNGELTHDLYFAIANKRMGIKTLDYSKNFLLQNNALSISLTVNFILLAIWIPKFSSVTTLMVNVWLLLLVLLLFFLPGSIWGFVQNLRFGIFYRKFFKHLHRKPAYVGTHINLTEMVAKRLRVLAGELEAIEAEYGKMSSLVSIARKELSDAHAFFLRLGLCSQDWGTYFDKTHER